MRRINIFLLFFACWIHALNVHAQKPRFKYLTSKDGISQSEVYCFLQDRQGFMWFGTVDGLNKYDGYEITTFNTEKNNPNALSNNTIRALVEDEKGRIWIGTDDGLNVYYPQKEMVYQIKMADRDMLKINSMCISGEHLLLATSQGVFVASIASNDLGKIEEGLKHLSFAEGVYAREFKTIISSSRGGFWVFDHNKVVRISVPLVGTEAIIVEKLEIEGHEGLISMVEDKHKNLWVATVRMGLIRLNAHNEAFDFYEHDPDDGSSIASNRCSSLEIDNAGNLWIGTLDNGLSMISAADLDKEEIEFNNICYDDFYPDNLNSNLIFSLYKSRDGLLWVGTIGSGVNVYDPNQKKFQHYKLNYVQGSLLSNFIRSVYADSTGRVWIGTHNNGLFLLDRDQESYEKLGFDTQSIFHISPYEGNKLFICSATGLHLVEYAQGNIKTLSSLRLNACFDLVRSKENTYWLASIHGVKQFSVIEDQIVSEMELTIDSKPKLSFNNSRVLCYNQEKNELLIGTEGGGLNIATLDEAHNPVRVSVFQKDSSDRSLSSNYIRSILKDSNKNIWIGTYEGLNKMIGNGSGTEFKTFKKEDGLPNNMIESIVEDAQGHLWIGTNGGLLKTDVDFDKYTGFTESDGLQSNEFSENAVYKKNDGELIFGGTNGISAFYPDEIKISNKEPNTTITKIYLFQKEVDLLKEYHKHVILEKPIYLQDTIQLLPAQNSIGFDFTAMIFNNPSKVKYKYKLEGFEDNWNITTAKNRHANYTNLKHGEYVFKVKSTNEDGIWEEGERQVFIQIQTPFYFSWYAYVVYIILIFLVFLFFRFFSIIHYETKHKLILENEHNKKMIELDDLRAKFFINISHDLRTPLTLIREPLKSILKAGRLDEDQKRKLLLVEKNAMHLNDLVEQLLDVRKAESGKIIPKLKKGDVIAFTRNILDHFNYALEEKGIHAQIMSGTKQLIASFDHDILSKVYSNLISNSVNHTDQGNITINIERVSKHQNLLTAQAEYQHYIKIEVKDNGQGISKDGLSKIFDRFYQDGTSTVTGYGIGLSYTKDLIRAHQGLIDIESEIGEGTTVTVLIPDQDFEAEKAKAKEIGAGNLEKRGSEHPVDDIEEDGKRVLIVDDNPDLREYIKSELDTDYTVIEAVDGVDGLEKACTSIPDLIISDVMMPKMDGVELCKELKSNLKTSHIPVILLTAKTDKKSRYHGIEIGADDYIAKPFDMEYLHLRINNLLQSREKLHQLFKKSISLNPSAVSVTSLDEKFLDALIKAIERGIPDPEFTVNSLEAEMGMSHANFYRKIKSLTGQSGKELLQEMRMKRARQILDDNSGLRVSEVAYMVGFTNPKYFSRCFKERFGFIPSELK